MNNDFVSLPPYVVNDINPVMGFAENIDWGTNTLKIPQIHLEHKLTGKGIKVAVIDTGVDPNHEDLQGAVIKTLNTTSEPYAFTNGHGTGCAGIIGARKNDKGILSVAPDCQIIAIKALTESGNGSMTDIVEAIHLAIAEGVHVINMSLGGGGGTPALQSAVEKAAAAGIYVICSAGNSGTDNSVGYPARYPQAYAIAATNQSNKVSAFSSRGQEVDIAAPGERILTTWKNGAYAVVSGTSFSAPYVSGCFALFCEAKIKMDHPRLKATAIDIEEPGQDHKSGYGLINPFEIIKRYKNLAEPKPCLGATGLTWTNITETSARLSWNPEPSAFNFSVCFKEKAGNNWKESQPTHGPFVDITNLKPGTEYDFYIRSNCANGTKPSETVTLKTLGTTTPETPPVNLTKIHQIKTLLDQFIAENTK